MLRLAGDAIEEGFPLFYGATCTLDTQCLDPVSECNEGTCQPVWWSWLIIAAVVVLLLILALVCAAIYFELISPCW